MFLNGEGTWFAIHHQELPPCVYIYRSSGVFSFFTSLFSQEARLVVLFFLCVCEHNLRRKHRV